MMRPRILAKSLRLVGGPPVDGAELCLDDEGPSVSTGCFRGRILLAQGAAKGDRG